MHRRTQGTVGRRRPESFSDAITEFLNEFAVVEIEMVDVMVILAYDTVLEYLT
jgi:hypothetical protein